VESAEKNVDSCGHAVENVESCGFLRILWRNMWTHSKTHSTACALLAEDVLKPAGEKIGLPDVSYHWFRRGHATVQHIQGVVDKPIQGQLRHSKAETTRNVYMQQVDPATWKAVVDLERRVSEKAANVATA
jgi:hypothetical protein